MMIMAAALATALFKRRISAILALGTMGYGISGLYLLLKAPDLALTQIMIESASVVLFLLVFYYLPELKPIPRSTAKKIRDWGIAGGLGVCATLAMAAAMNTHKFRTIADYFMRTSKPVAGFKNVVNAIIVDYRGYDTAGRDHRAGHRRDSHLRHRAAGGRTQMGSLILQTIAPAVLHLTLLFSFFLLIYGHNQPGGGFIAGLMTSVGIVLQWVAVDAEEGWRPVQLAL